MSTSNNWSFALKAPYMITQKILVDLGFSQIPGPSSSLFGGGCGVLRFSAQPTGESYYSTSLYVYSVPKKVPEYRYPLYRSTGIRFKKVVLKG